MTDKCPNCGKPFIVLNTKVKDGVRIQYSGCRQCKIRPENNKTIVRAH